MAIEGENRLNPIQNPAISEELIDEAVKVQDFIRKSGRKVDRPPPDEKCVGGAQSGH